MKLSEQVGSAFDVLNRKIEAEKARADKAEATLKQIEIHLANTGACDSPSCLLWGHLAQLLRQDGYAKGPPFDEHFKGTSMES